MTHHRRITGLFEFYCLHSIKQGPKSGYDIIKEIKEKSKDHIVPSKGTIYPLLDNLEKKEIIEIEKLSARGKKTFKLTDKGIRHLEEHHKRKRCIRNKMKYLPFIFSEFRGVHNDIEHLLLQIYHVAEEKSKQDKVKVKKILVKNIKELERI